MSAELTGTPGPNIHNRMLILILTNNNISSHSLKDFTITEISHQCLNYSWMTQVKPNNDSNSRFINSCTNFDELCPASVVTLELEMSDPIVSEQWLYLHKLYFIRVTNAEILHETYFSRFCIVFSIKLLYLLFTQLEWSNKKSVMAFGLFIHQIYFVDLLQNWWKIFQIDGFILVVV